MIEIRHPHTLFAFLFFTGACWSSQDDFPTTVIVSIDQSAVHVGENVTLTCRVSTSGSEAVDLSSGFQWRKSTTLDDNNEEVIADDEELSPLYEQFGAGRYEVEMVQLPEVTLFLLHIHLVQHEDSGRIRCAFSSAFYQRNGQDIANLQVYKRPSVGDVYFSDYAEDSELTVEENIPTSLTCIVHRVLPQPHVSIHIHNRSVGYHLPTSVTVNVHCPVADRRKQSSRGAATSKTCPVHYDLDLAVTASHLTATHRDDEQRVTCTAGLSLANWTPIITSLHLNVRYRPRFNCSKSLSIQLGSRNVEIRCQLRYNPRPLQLLVRWRHNGDSNDTILDVDNSIGDRYSLHETVLDARSWKQMEMVFIISQVHQKDYVVYHFEATNDVGTSTHSVHLIQHHPPRTPVLTTPTPTTSAIRPTSTPHSSWSRPVNSGAVSSERFAVLLLTTVISLSWTLPRLSTLNIVC